MLIALALFLFQAADLSGVAHTDPVPSELAAPVAAKAGAGGRSRDRERRDDHVLVGQGSSRRVAEPTCLKGRSSAP